MTYLWHINLTTGHSRRSLRKDVSDDVVRILADWINTTLGADGRIAPLPAYPEYVGRVTSAASALLVTVMRLQDNATLVTIGVARRSRDARKLWDMLNRDRPVGTHVGDLPHPPWCAVRTEPGLLYDLGAAGWLLDLERCIAWAWIEGRDRDEV